MGELKDRISADLKTAMKARDQLRIDTLRSALSGFIYKRSEAGKDPSDAEELDVVAKIVKQRGDSLAEFEKAGRDDLAQRERAEREILLAYLPARKSSEEIRAIVTQALEQLDPAARNQGAAMKAVMPLLRGQADGAEIRAIVLELLATS